MYFRMLFLVFMPGLLLAQQPTTAVPTAPSLPPKQQSQPTTPKEAVKSRPVTLTKESIELPKPSEGTGPEEFFFAHPGILFKKKGEWVGDDHLFNVDKNIEIFVEVEKTKEVRIPIDTKRIKDLIAFIFKKTTIVPEPDGDHPPFPYFHMLIMVTPIEKGYAVYCGARLFESVTLNRVNLEKDVFFQAITWEKQALLVIPADKFKEELEGAVVDITNYFVDRYRHFDDIKQQREAKRE